MVLLNHVVQVFNLAQPAGPVGAVVGAPLGAAAGAVAGTVGAVGTAAGAVAGGPLVVNVTPGNVPPAVGVPVVINGVVYDRVPVRALFTTGPRYPERSGVRVGRGSVIPEWIDAAPMRNVSIRRLRPGSPYGYFVSTDNKVVVIEPGSRRVARVIVGPDKVQSFSSPGRAPAPRDARRQMSFPGRAASSDWCTLAI